MGSGGGGYLRFAIGSALVLTSAGSRSETINYSYDALGRLVTSATSGGTNNGVNSTTCFDPGGNRTRYVSALSGTTSCSSSSTPPPSNQPPVANSDSASVGICMTVTKNVTANDTDPESNYPLSVIAVGSSPKGDATIASGSSINFSAYGTAGNTSVSYTVQDSLGATSTGTLYITITNGSGCD